FGALCLAGALAFGLGSRDLAGEIVRALPQGQAEPAVGEHALAVWWVAQTPDQARSIARALRTLDKLARRDHPASEFCFMETEHHWRGRGAARFLRLGVGATN